MKRIKFFFAALVCLFAVNTACNAHDFPISTNMLPAAAKLFVQQNFPGRVIAYAKVDTDHANTKYEVCLNDGTEIEFYADGSVDDIDCHYTPVPVTVVPETIQEYVETVFPGTSIVKVDRKYHGYEVELSNDMELKFNNRFGFLGIDD